MRLSDWLYRTTDQTSRISLARLFKLIFNGATELQLCEQHQLVTALETDFDRSGEKGRRPWETRNQPRASGASARPGASINTGLSATRKTAATRQRRGSATTG
jgi:hypothetical protein